jgi:hypothetical protein
MSLPSSSTCVDRVDDEARLKKYYEKPFDSLQQLNCRVISKALIKLVSVVIAPIAIHGSFQDLHQFYLAQTHKDDSQHCVSRVGNSHGWKLVVIEQPSASVPSRKLISVVRELSK